MYKFSLTWWWLYTKIEFRHQILCIKIRIPTLKENIPPAENLSRAKCGTFSSLLSFKKNCVTDFSQNFYSEFHNFGLKCELTKSANNAVAKIAYHMTIWKDHKYRTIWSIFLLKKVLASPDSLLCLQTVVKLWKAVPSWGKSPFVKFRNCIGSANIRFSMNDVIPWILYADWLKCRV